MERRQCFFFFFSISPSFQPVCLACMDMPQKIRLQELFSRYLEKRCEPAEVAELVGLLEQADAAEALTEPMRVLWDELKGRTEEYPAVDWDSMYSRISQVEDDLSILNRR